MKIKTSGLIDAALDWAVAKCLTGGELFQCGRVAHQVVLHSVGGTTAPYFMKDSGVIRCAFEPSENWSQGGPIIEREGIDLYCNVPTNPAHKDPSWRGSWRARYSRCGYGTDMYHGTTPLIAAMRCYVASNLGDDVVIPNELIGE